MKIEQTTYTHLRENLAPHLREVLKNKTVLEVIWRNHEPSIVISKKHYDKLIKNELATGHVNVGKPLDGHGQVRTFQSKISYGQKDREKTPPSLISDPQHDLFQ